MIPPAVTPSPAAFPAGTRRKAVFLLIVVELLAVGWFLRNAWVAEDAFITYRTIDNLLHGFGLRWNVTERVQTFTHPLWLFLHLPLAAFLRIDYASMALSLACLLLFWWLAMRAFPPDIVLLILFFPAWASLCISEFAASGLEVSLSYLLIILFWRLVQSGPADTKGRVFAATLVMALAGLSRPDLLLLLGLPWAAACISRKLPARLIAAYALLGLIPLIAWHLFSLWYYGFPFPNTYYAKVQTGIPASLLIRQGLKYLADLFHRDPVGGAFLAVLPFTAGLMLWKRKRNALFYCALGGLLYSLFVIRIGGDFMFGRFWAPAVLVGMLAAATLVSEMRPPARALACAAVFIACSIFGHFRAPSFDDRPAPSGIIDERSCYAATNLLWDLPSNGPLRHSFAQKGLRFRMLARQKGGQILAVSDTIGMAGYFGGPAVTWIDVYAITDRFLARLPVADPQHWRVGHFERKIPENYVAARMSGNAGLLAPAYAPCYRSVREAATGPLFSAARLKTILLLNLGRVPAPPGS